MPYPLPHIIRPLHPGLATQHVLLPPPQAWLWLGIWEIFGEAKWPQMFTLARVPSITDTRETEFGDGDEVGERAAKIGEQAGAWWMLSPEQSSKEVKYLDGAIMDPLSVLPALFCSLPSPPLPHSNKWLS